VDIFIDEVCVEVAHYKVFDSNKAMSGHTVTIWGKEYFTAPTHKRQSTENNKVMTRLF